jgi:hypothetical protein
MALNIKNDEVESLAKALATQKNQSMVQVILDALQAAKKAHEQGELHKAKLRLQALDAWFQNLKIRNAQFPQVVTSVQAQAELYDEFGVPK